jgi:Uma2 family endonuclease
MWLSAVPPLRPDDRLIRDPVLIVEVLSPSTAVSDRQFKVADYRRIPSVEEILLIDSESAFAEVLRRERDQWISVIAQGREAVLRLQSLPLSVTLAELYDGIPLPDVRSSAIGSS